MKPIRVHKKLLFRYALDYFEGEVSEPTICPICGYAIKPEEMFCKNYETGADCWRIVTVYLCANCRNPFLTHQSCTLGKKSNGHYKGTFVAKLLPMSHARPRPQEFTEHISLLSPSFVEIYNQAAAAEFYGLNEIAGTGYRKSIEFLIKDFCIHNDPDAEDAIKAMPLSVCINKRITDKTIRKLALSAVWLGNDETHYIRVHADQAIEHMKQFMEAAIAAINHALVEEKAASMVAGGQAKANT